MPTRGFMDPVGFWDRTYKPATATECLKAGESQPIGTLRAWRVGAGGVACYDESINAWGGRISGLNIYFPNRVTAEQANKVAAQILPTDAQQTGSTPGANLEGRGTPNGACQQTAFTSQALAAVVRAANPSWTGDPARVTATLYTGHADETGSDRAYRADSVGQASISLGNSVAGPDGKIYC